MSLLVFTMLSVLLGIIVMGWFIAVKWLNKSI